MPDQKKIDEVMRILLDGHGPIRTDRMPPPEGYNYDIPPERPAEDRYVPRRAEEPFDEEYWLGLEPDGDGYVPPRGRESIARAGWEYHFVPGDDRVAERLKEAKLREQFSNLPEGWRMHTRMKKGAPPTLGPQSGKEQEPGLASRLAGSAKEEVRDSARARSAYLKLIARSLGL